MSKKYILAKDLPFAKRGTEVNVSGDRIFVQRGKSKLEACIDALELWDSTSENIQKELQRLIDEGWIEEAKPREWFVGITDKNIPCYIGDDKPDAKLNQLNGFLFMGENISTIKVREVLE